MKIYHIAAMDQNRVIGKDGEIPWNLSDDLRRFKELTNGHSVIMGRKTFQSIVPHAPLRGRTNIVLTSRNHLYIDGRPVDGFVDDGEGTTLMVANSLAEAFEISSGSHEVYVIGGQSVYEKTLDIVDGLRLTHVHREIEGGDTYYPDLNGDEWVPTFQEDRGDTHTYIDYVRRPDSD